MDKIHCVERHLSCSAPRSVARHRPAAMLRVETPQFVLLYWAGCTAVSDREQDHDEDGDRDDADADDADADGDAFLLSCLPCQYPLVAIAFPVLYKVVRLGSGAAEVSTRRDTMFA